MYDGTGARLDRPQESAGDDLNHATGTTNATRPTRRAEPLFSKSPNTLHASGPLVSLSRNRSRFRIHNPRESGVRDAAPFWIHDPRSPARGVVSRTTPARSRRATRTLSSMPRRFLCAFLVLIFAYVHPKSGRELGTLAGSAGRSPHAGRERRGLQRSCKNLLKFHPAHARRSPRPQAPMPKGACPATPTLPSLLLGPANLTFHALPCARTRGTPRTRHARASCTSDSRNHHDHHAPNASAMLHAPTPARSILATLAAVLYAALRALTRGAATSPLSALDGASTPPPRGSAGLPLPRARPGPRRRPAPGIVPRHLDLLMPEVSRTGLAGPADVRRTRLEYVYTAWARVRARNRPLEAPPQTSRLRLQPPYGRAPSLCDVASSSRYPSTWAKRGPRAPHASAATPSARRPALPVRRRAAVDHDDGPMSRHAHAHCRDPAPPPRFAPRAPDAWTGPRERYLDSPWGQPSGHLRRAQNERVVVFARTTTTRRFGHARRNDPPGIDGSPSRRRRVPSFFPTAREHGPMLAATPAYLLALLGLALLALALKPPRKPRPTLTHAQAHDRDDLHRDRAHEDHDDGDDRAQHAAHVHNHGARPTLPQGPRRARGRQRPARRDAHRDPARRLLRALVAFLRAHAGLARARHAQPTSPRAGTRPAHAARTPRTRISSRTRPPASRTSHSLRPNVLTSENSHYWTEPRSTRGIAFRATPRQAVHEWTSHQLGLVLPNLLKGQDPPQRHNARMVNTTSTLAHSTTNTTNPSDTEGPDAAQWEVISTTHERHPSMLGLPTAHPTRRTPLGGFLWGMPGRAVAGGTDHWKRCHPPHTATPANLHLLASNRPVSGA